MYHSFRAWVKQYFCWREKKSCFTSLTSRHFFLLICTMQSQVHATFDQFPVKTENLMCTSKTRPYFCVSVFLRFGCESAEAGRRGRAGIMRKSRSVLTVSPNNVSPRAIQRPSYSGTLGWNLLIMCLAEAAAGQWKSCASCWRKILPFKLSI